MCKLVKEQGTPSHTKHIQGALKANPQKRSTKNTLTLNKIPPMLQNQTKALSLPLSTC